MSSRWIFTEDGNAALQASHINRLFLDRDVTHDSEWVLKAVISGSDMVAVFVISRHYTKDKAVEALKDTVTGREPQRG